MVKASEILNGIPIHGLCVFNLLVQFNCEFLKNQFSNECPVPVVKSKL